MCGRSIRSCLVVAAAGVLFVGCAPSLGDARARDADRAVPSGWLTGAGTVTSSTATASVAAGRAEVSAARAKVMEFFTDPNLVALIDGALENNQELNILVQEIVVTNNEVLARQGEYLPRLDFRAGAGIEKVGKYTSQGISDATSEYEPGKEVPEHLQNYVLGFHASWEVDIWKKLRNATKAAVFRYLSSIEGRDFMITRLVAEIANSYFELMALDNQLAVVERNIEIQQSALQVVILQKEAARVTELAVQRFQAEVLKNRSRKYEIRQQIVETENRINLLVGRFPQPVARSSERFEGLTLPVIEAGLPVQLLENRPDVKQAELELSAAKLDVDVARAGFYPSLSIEAGVGIEAFDVRKLVMFPESILYGLAAGLVAPLFNRNALTAAYFTANAKQMAAVYNYEQTILRAYTEAANQLAMIDNLDKSYALKAQQVERLTESISISTGLFKSARADYMEVLMTRRDALEAQMELIETKKSQLNAMVNIYQALGGGWRR